MAPRALHAVLVSVLLATGAGCTDDAPTEPSTSTGGAPTEVDGSAAAPGSTPPGSGDIDLTGTVVAQLDEPIALVARPGDDLLWVAERAGTVRRLERSAAGDLVPEGDPVLDITDRTSTESERGLLGIAFSTDGSVLYVSHTDAGGDSRVASYDVVDDTVDAGSRLELLEVEQPFPNHNGGHVVVTDDDALYLGLGDGGAADDPENRAQDPDTLLGKLVRVNTTGEGDHEIVASGLRNPWRYSFEPDGSVWIADVGQNAVEEINRIAADDLPGANFGWSGYEGDEPYLSGDGRRPDDPVMPVFTYRHDDGNCSVTGGFVVRRPDLGLDGAYVFADYCVGTVEAIWVDADGELAGHRDLAVAVDGPVSFGTGAGGEVYVLSAAGAVVRIDPA
ncbi:MAG: PQQ-dependent sugar dehydrogenase [Acidimicrobiales bacterium]|mgnify:CR=1 FL=1|nr:PQQ-dependent sugar dehydrogenase [Acidimicrobiales bacterium]